MLYIFISEEFDDVVILSPEKSILLDPSFLLQFRLISRSSIRRLTSMVSVKRNCIDLKDVIRASFK